MTDTLAPDVKDLNALVPPRRKAALGSQVYEVPGDMPMEVYLRMQMAFSDEVDEIASANALKQALVDLLLWYVPEGPTRASSVELLEQEARSIGVRTVLQILNAIYSDLSDEDEDDAVAEGKDSPTTVEETPTTTGDSSTESSPTPL